MHGARLSVDGNGAIIIFMRLYNGSGVGLKNEAGVEFAAVVMAFIKQSAVAATGIDGVRANFGRKNPSIEVARFELNSINSWESVVGHLGIEVGKVL